MFPHACGETLRELVEQGADPFLVIPDDFIVVRGGTRPPPPAGQVFSVAVGPTLEAAASAVPYNQIRVTSVSAVRSQGGAVEWLAEHSPHGTLNEQHANVIEYGSSSFSEPIPNPVPKKDRIDAGQ